MAFTIQWLQIIIQIISFYFIATLIGRGQHFGLLGGAIPYFSYVVVNLAFARFQMTALQSFQTAIRGDQMLGTLEVVMAIFESAAYGRRVELPQRRRDHPLLRWRREAGLPDPPGVPRDYKGWLAEEDVRMLGAGG